MPRLGIAPNFKLKLPSERRKSEKQRENKTQFLFPSFSGYYFNDTGLLVCEPFYGKPSYRILATCSLYFPTTMILMYCYGSSFHASRFRFVVAAASTPSSIPIASTTTSTSLSSHPVHPLSVQHQQQQLQSRSPPPPPSSDASSSTSEKVNILCSFLFYLFDVGLPHPGSSRFKPRNEITIQDARQARQFSLI